MNAKQEQVKTEAARKTEELPGRELTEEELRLVIGGLLLPAVQKVREAAAR